MPEYIVDCRHQPYGDGKMLVLPISIGGHVHERITRCRDCHHCYKVLVSPHDERYECRVRTYSRHFTSPDGYCDQGVQRGGG